MREDSGSILFEFILEDSFKRNNQNIHVSNGWIFGARARNTKIVLENEGQEDDERTGASGVQERELDSRGDAQEDFNIYSMSNKDDINQVNKRN